MLTSTRDWRRRENNPRTPYKGLFGLWYHSPCQFVVLGQSPFNRDPQNILHPSALQLYRSHICCTLASLIMTRTQANTYLVCASTRGLSVARSTCWHLDRLVKSSPLLQCVRGWLISEVPHPLPYSAPAELCMPSYEVMIKRRKYSRKSRNLTTSHFPWRYLPLWYVWWFDVDVCVCSSMVISPGLVGLWVLACGFAPSRDKV